MQGSMAVDFHWLSNVKVHSRKILRCVTEATGLQIATEILSISYVTCGKITYNFTKYLTNVLLPLTVNIILLSGIQEGN